MNYRLKPGKELSQSIRHIAGRQAEGIGQCLERGAKQAGAVHAARTHIKKLRALARLIRQPLGKKSYADCNDILKSLAKSLSPLRDATVRLRTLERLKQAHPEQLAAQPELQTLLTEAQKAKLQASSRSAGWRKRQVSRLLKMIAAWPLNGIRKQTLKRGIARGNRRVRKDFKAARHMPTVKKLHAWRKTAKDLMHQMALVERIARMDDQQMARLKKVGLFLGDDHDLAMFEIKATGLRRPVSRTILKLIRKKRTALQKAAFKLGRKLKPA